MVAAQNTDLQRVWRLVQDLSTQLTANQQETERLKRHIEFNATHQSPSPSTSHGHGGYKSGQKGKTAGDEDYQALKHAYTLLADEHSAMTTEKQDLSQLCAEYETGLATAMTQIRTHQYAMTTATLELHRNYHSQIQEKISENEVLKDQVVSAQAHLIRLSGLIRDALTEHSDVTPESIIESLAKENEAVRSRLVDLEHCFDVKVS